MGAKRIFNALVIALAVDSVIEIITGVHLALSYQPDANHAYASLQEIKARGALNFEQSFHHWMSAVIIIAAGFTLLFGLITASYKNSSRKLWLSNVLLVVIYVLFQLTGHVLPWDQHAVRTAVVETGIAQSAPVIGATQANWLRGGPTVGNHTLTIWFWAHVIVLSVLWLFFTWVAVRKARISGVYKPAVIVGFLFDIAVAAALAMYLPVRFGNAASAADFSSFTARPEWYILPLHQLLVLLQRIDTSMGWIGTMLIPGLVLLLVLFAPWLDIRSRLGKTSVFGPAFGVLLFAGACVLFSMGFSELASPAGPNLFTSEAQKQPSTRLDPKLVAQGEAVFKTQDCMSCHNMNTNSDIAPALAGTGGRHPSVDWHLQHLKLPSSTSPGSTMPSYARLGEAKLKALAAYLASLR